MERERAISVARSQDDSSRKLRKKMIETAPSIEHRLVPVVPIRSAPTVCIGKRQKGDHDHERYVG